MDLKYDKTYSEQPDENINYKLMLRAYHNAVTYRHCPVLNILRSLQCRLQISQLRRALRPNKHGTSELAILLLVGAAAAQFQCPADDGFYVDPRQCDKYYDCYRGPMTEKLCPDGLIFDTTPGPRVEQCNYPFLVECPEGNVLQAPQPAGIQCPRQNGYFEHEDPANCEEYYECTNGEAQRRACATGLVFDEFTGT